MPRKRQSAPARWRKLPPPDATRFRQLDPQRIVETAERLRRRINERFPLSDLALLGSELLAAAREAPDKSRTVAQPLIGLRIGLGLVIGALIAALSITGYSMVPQSGPSDWADFAQGLDAILNVLIVGAGAVISLVTIERRIKRRRALRAIHELRVMAHVVELHQLTKDPDRLLSPGHDTASSPRVNLSAFELTRYLDYCSEMLAVIGNLAALYAQRDDDPVTLEAIDAVESLTATMSAKIWQKIMIANEMVHTAQHARPRQHPDT